MTQKMQAIQIKAYGGPEVMELVELPIPQPGPGEALVRVQAASVNFIDLQYRRGDLAKQEFYKREGATQEAFPLTLGSQGAGVVEALGPGVTHVKVGDRVMVGGKATYATHVIAPANRLTPIPDSVTTEQAAASLFQGFMAYGLSHLAYAVQPGQWCLVHAAAGGIGLLLTQMIKIRGGKVIGVTSTEAKAQYAREAGADEIIISTQSNIVTEVKRITGGKGVSVVYDGVGLDTFAAGIDSLAPRGYMVVFGQSSGFVPPFDIMELQEKGSLYLTRFSALYFYEEWPRYIQDYVTWLREGKLSIRIERTYPLADAAQAHAAFEARQVSGRVLLLP